MTTDVIINEYLEEKATFSPSTLSNYRTQLNHFNKVCKSKGIDILSAQEKDVAEYLNQYSFIKTKKSYKTILNVFYRWCIKKKYLTDNPTEDITIKNGTKKKHKLMKYSDFENMLNECEGLRDRTILTFLWYTGVRARELITIRLEDVDMDNGLVYVSQSKTETGLREIGVHPALRPILLEYLRVSSNIRKTTDNIYPELFLNKWGKPISSRTLIFLVDKVQKRLGTNFGCHDFRRAFVTNVFNKSKDIVLAQEMAGHADISTTRGYILSNPDENARKFKSLDF